MDKENSDTRIRSDMGSGSYSLSKHNSKFEDLIDSCAKLNAAKGTNEQKVGDFYASAMDSTGIERKGFSHCRQTCSA
jgi:putative endopeptidase